jgi:hypothetical protein
VKLIFVKFKQKLNFEFFLTKIPEYSLPFVLHVCEFVLQNTLYSFLRKNKKNQIWEHVPKFI